MTPIDSLIAAIKQYSDRFTNEEYFEILKAMKKAVWDSYNEGAQMVKDVYKTNG